MNKRIDNDYYPTPQALTQALIAQLPPNYFKGTILEPCAGDGAIARAFDDEYRIITNDIDPQWKCDYNYDATDDNFWTQIIWTFGSSGVDWVITNPPFNQSFQILPLAWDHCTIGMAMLLRITYAEPCRNRKDWLIEHRDHLRYFIPVSAPRPRFRADIAGTDSTTVAWFVWDKRWSWADQGIDPPFKFIVDWNA